MSTPDPAVTDYDVVQVSTPADGVYVATLRLTAASLAARCDLTVDDIEDLRLAVDEACSLLLPHATASSTLDARFEVGVNRLEVACSVSTTGTAQPDREGITWTVLAALATDVRVDTEDGRLTIGVAKQREVAQQ